MVEGSSDYRQLVTGVAMWVEKDYSVGTKGQQAMGIIWFVCVCTRIGVNALMLKC